MHLHFDFSASQILWIITFAAELVLLIVLLGRDRARRFPWFTSSIIVGALMLLVSRLLFGRMSPITTSSIFLTLSDVAAIIGLAVVAEVARRAFIGAPRRAWIIGTIAAFVVALAILIAWGPWPARNAFTGGSLLITLRSMQLVADKGSTLGSLLGIELGLVTVFFGRRYKGGWRTHPQQIAIGLSTAAIAQLAVRILWEHMAKGMTIRSRAEYQHAIDLRDRVYNANNFIFFLVLVWWIAWLWLEEPGKESPAANVETFPEEPAPDR